MQCSGVNLKTCTYILQAAALEDNGNYLCEGSNTIDSVNHPSDDTLDLNVCRYISSLLKSEFKGCSLKMPAYVFRILFSAIYDVDALFFNFQSL